MKSIVIAAALISVAGLALAEPSCSVPKEKWMPEAAFKKSVEAQGYTIKTFKVNKGQCYEIYGMKDGKKVEHWFDPATGAQVTQ
ncbi:PepSY domain-containing protein [Hydrogenophaga sp.]|uniref:PepSY domain-containing protein n=1 Tax=Hydrogenophaga sp. TaxID=1904254 RepID=UPI0025C2BD49|nr:PepSY domain-containing protein [Hydrogenophaga sp.]